MTLVVFDKNAAGPPFSMGQTTSVAFGPYFAGDVVELAPGSVTKLKDAVHTNTDSNKKANKHTADY